METFGERVKRLRERRGISQAELARLVGWTSGYVSLIEANLRLVDALPRHDYMLKLARELGVSVEELAGEREAAPPPAARPDFLLAPLPVLLKRLGAEKARDLLFDMRASADPARRVPKSDRIRPRKPHYVIEVEGECMVPELHPGDVVHFDPDLQPEHGDWVVATLDGGSATVKRLVVTGGVMQQLLPLNGEPLVIDENVRIVGVVLTYERPGPRGKRGRR
jgi:transcriptional regulator with XRE-family HTH domain